MVEGNEGEAGERVTAGAAASPVPLRTRVCGLPGALSATWRSAVKLPTLAGLKVMLTEQFALGARVVAGLTKLLPIHESVEEALAQQA